MEECGDRIFLKKEDIGFFGPPVVKAEKDPNYIKHVYCEGARFHVSYWNIYGEHCSESNCIINKRVNEMTEEEKQEIRIKSILGQPTKKGLWPGCLG